MEVTRVDGWEKLVTNLKRIRTFGFHGAENKNLQAIIKDIPRTGGVFGHYFGANSDMLKEKDSLFYQRLYSSVGIAQGFSRAYNVNEGKIEVKDDLLLIFGMAKNEDIDLFLGRSASGTYGDTLAIGHDMGNWFDFYPLVLNKRELGEIDERAEPIRKRGRKFPCPHIGTGYFIEQNIIEGLLAKMKKVSDKYVKSNK